MRRTVTCYAFIIFLLLPAIVLAQSKKVQGIVKSKSSGLPLAGVTVQGSTIDNVSTSDAGGNFSINIDKGPIITFSHVGYETQQVVVDSATTRLVVELAASDRSLDAVVVTALGYSRQRKSLGYATQELKQSDISEAKEVNIVNALAGKVAGVRTTNSQGDMGSSRIVIRGETSIAL